MLPSSGCFCFLLFCFVFVLIVLLYSIWIKVFFAWFFAWNISAGMLRFVWFDCCRFVYFHVTGFDVLCCYSVTRPLSYERMGLLFLLTALQYNSRTRSFIQLILAHHLKCCKDALPLLMYSRMSVLFFLPFYHHLVLVITCLALINSCLFLFCFLIMYLCNLVLFVTLINVFNLISLLINFVLRYIHLCFWIIKLIFLSNFYLQCLSLCNGFKRMLKCEFDVFYTSSDMQLVGSVWRQPCTTTAFCYVCMG